MSRNINGSIYLIIGCMFSNKTLELIKSVEKHYYAKKRCVIIKHSIDTRYDHLAKHGGIVCNNGIEYSIIPVITCTTLSTIDISAYDVIGVTEAQFYEDLLIVDEWATAGKIIICDGLDGDVNRDSFGNIHSLLSKCEKVIKLNAVCISCGADAAFTKRRSQCQSTTIVDPGGSEKYIPVCRGCYMEQ